MLDYNRHSRAYSKAKSHVSAALTASILIRLNTA